MGFSWHTLTMGLGKHTLYLQVLGKNTLTMGLYCLYCTCIDKHLLAMGLKVKIHFTLELTKLTYKHTLYFGTW